MSAARFNTRRSVRRQFVHALPETRAVVSGWVLVHALPVDQPGSRATANPRAATLAADVVVEPTRSGATVYRASQRHLGPVAQVNPAARYLLEHVDGRRTVDDLALGLMRILAARRGLLEAYGATVSLFLANLTAGDLLDEPFEVRAAVREVAS